MAIGPARLPASACRPGLHAPSAAVQFFYHRDQRPELKVEPKDLAYPLCLYLVHQQRAALRRDVITEHRIAADPFSFAPRGAHLVVRSFRDHLAFELREGQQDVQRQSAQRVGGVELLRHRHKRHALFVEDLDDPGEIKQ